MHTAIDNPANAYFGEWAASVSLLKDYVRDDRMNFDGERRQSGVLGVVGSSPGFGLFVGRRLPSQESALDGRVDVQETHAGAALPIGDRFTLGGALISARADWIGFGEAASHASAWSFAFGARMKASDALLLGVSYRPRISLQRPNHSDYRSLVEIPSRLLIGATFLTGTSFRFHVTTSIFGRDDDTVALNDPGRPAGRAISLQPRFGVEYMAYKNDPIQLDLYAGTYFEPGRIQGLSTRTHFTAGAGLKFLSGRASLAVDRASGYANTTAAVGIDVLDLIVKAGIIRDPKSAGQE
jgi:hypothetical protein